MNMRITWFDGAAAVQGNEGAPARHLEFPDSICPICLDRPGVDPSGFLLNPSAGPLELIVVAYRACQECRARTWHMEGAEMERLRRQVRNMFIAWLDLEHSAGRPRGTA